MVLLFSSLVIPQTLVQEDEAVCFNDDFHGVTEVVRSSGVHADSRDGDDEDSVVQEVILDCWWFLCSW